MIVMWSLGLFVVLTGMLYVLGVNVWLGPKSIIERVSGQNWAASHEATHPSLVFRDVLQKLGNLVPASSKDMSVLQRRLMRAGIRGPSALKIFYGVKAILVVVLPVVAFGLTLRFHVEGSNQVAAIAAGAALGFFGPNKVLESLIKRRHKRLRKGLPNALDLMVVCVESGLGLDQAIMQVSKELHQAHPDISQEFALLNLDLRHGKRRAEALHDLAQRTGVEDLKKLAAVLIQADRFGTSIGQSLRNHSEYMRITARQDAETRAAKIGIKLVFPIFFCILPALFVVTVGPVVVRIMRDLLPMMDNL
ncbi:MAG TPA: type II secretion system F family protein [Bryobacterales bacterium]|nr:type II secretion system F family protein [Bryobacterales bacterium]